MKPVVRFALSPTGRIPIGNLRPTLAVRAQAATIGTCRTPYKSLNALASLLDFDKLSRAPARFDIDELKSLNTRLLHELDYSEAAGRLGEPPQLAEGRPFETPFAAICTSSTTRNARRSL